MTHVKRKEMLGSEKRKEKKKEIRWWEYKPSDEMEAPESLNSSDPIWMGNTRSCGKILGILDMSWGVEGGRWRGLGASLEFDALIVGNDAAIRDESKTYRAPVMCTCMYVLRRYVNYVG